MRDLTISHYTQCDEQPDSFKKILLTKGQFTFVDKEDFERVNQFKWYALQDRIGFYAERKEKDKDGKFTIHLKLQNYIMHPPKGMIVDHINGDKLDNRKINLRVCTYSQNQMNRKVPVNNKTGYKGVDFYKKNGKFRAMIFVSSKRLFIGYYDTAKEAAKAYNLKAIECFGAYAKENKI